ncbi:hypothetical protein QTN25_006984 [Entamoeba marina]
MQGFIYGNTVEYLTILILTSFMSEKDHKQQDQNDQNQQDQNDQNQQDQNDQNQQDQNDQNQQDQNDQNQQDNSTGKVTISDSFDTEQILHRDHANANGGRANPKANYEFFDEQQRAAIERDRKLTMPKEVPQEQDEPEEEDQKKDSQKQDEPEEEDQKKRFTKKNRFEIRY